MCVVLGEGRFGRISLERCPPSLPLAREVCVAGSELPARFRAPPRPLPSFLPAPRTFVGFGARITTTSKLLTWARPLGGIMRSCARTARSRARPADASVNFKFETATPSCARRRSAAGYRCPCSRRRVIVDIAHEQPVFVYHRLVSRQLQPAGM